eukprot:1611709-Amphidinium_carterae.1
MKVAFGGALCTNTHRRATSSTSVDIECELGDTPGCAEEVPQTNCLASPQVNRLLKLKRAFGHPLTLGICMLCFWGSGHSVTQKRSRKWGKWVPSLSAQEL